MTSIRPLILSLLEGESSIEVPVECAVPQETVLRPILVLCHINDLQLTVKSQVRLCTDDYLLYKEVQTYQGQPFPTGTYEKPIQIFILYYLEKQHPKASLQPPLRCTTHFR